MTLAALALTGTVGMLTLSALGAGTAQAQTSASVPTFAKDVAPILFNNCTTCHRPGEVGPMPLLSYDHARPWAKAIKEKVVAREMPPWGADARNSLKMRNDRSLTQSQIDTIVAWVDGGAPRGNDADLPALPKFTSGWQHGEPEYVFEMPTDFEIPAEGELVELYFYTPITLKGDRFAEALELRPGNNAVVHHAGAYIADMPEGVTLKEGQTYDANGKMLWPDDLRKLLKPGGSVFEPLAGSTKLISYVPGRGLEVHRPGIGKRIPEGKWLQFEMHYNPTGKVETDRSKLGIWYNTRPVTHEVINSKAGSPLPTDEGAKQVYIAEGKEVIYEGGDTTRSRATIPTIPPYAENWTITGVTPIPEPITLYSLTPHMHLRGKSLKWVVTYPDGRDQTILDVPRYDFNWQLQYELETPLHIPAGSKVIATAVYDNSLKNRWNPAPHLEVFWSEQSWDEMFQPTTQYTVDSQDLTKMRPAQQQQQ